MPHAPKVGPPSGRKTQKRTANNRRTISCRVLTRCPVDEASVRYVLCSVTVTTLNCTSLLLVSFGQSDYIAISIRQILGHQCTAAPSCLRSVATRISHQISHKCTTARTTSALSHRIYMSRTPLHILSKTRRSSARFRAEAPFVSRLM